MSVRTNLNEEAGVYELGDDIEGVFVPFVTMTKTAVDAHVTSVLSNEAQTTEAATTQAAATDSSKEYEDNGDGTYTRESDGAVGTFGPNGFTANQ